jgi:hypothetical protein
MPGPLSRPRRNAILGPRGGLIDPPRTKAGAAFRSLDCTQARHDQTNIKQTIDWKVRDLILDSACDLIKSLWK